MFYVTSVRRISGAGDEDDEVTMRTMTMRTMRTALGRACQDFGLSKLRVKPGSSQGQVRVKSGSSQGQVRVKSTRHEKLP